MAIRPKVFPERILEAAGLIALYNDAQQMRALLGLFPEAALGQSDLANGLSSLARYVFVEIVLRTEPLSWDEHASIFDAIDFNWAERLRVIHSDTAPLISAHKRLPMLIADLEAVEIEGKDQDLVCRLREQVVQFIDPNTVDQVRQFPRVLQGLGLVHLLDQYKTSPRLAPGRVQESESWIFTFLNPTADEIAEVMGDSKIHTAADIVDWARRREHMVATAYSRRLDGR